MRNKRRFLSLLMIVAMILTLLPTATFALYVDDTGENAYTFDVSRSKIATPLTKDKNGDYTSTITLSIPSAEEELTSDVVFVIDDSDCYKEVKEQFYTILEDLIARNVNIRVGVVYFRGNATEVNFPLRTLDEAYEEELKATIERPNEGGSNMHAGLLAAQDMLENSSTIDARKYMILISDGIAYTWDEDGVQTQIPTRYADGGQTDIASNSVWEQWHGSLDWMPDYNDWGTYFTNNVSNIENAIAEFAIPYDRNITPEDGIFPDGYEKYASSVDVALYKAMTVYNELSEKYNCYAMNPYDDGRGQYGDSFMRYLSNEKMLNLFNIEDDILYAVSSGSIILDDIDPVFELANGMNSFTLTVGGEKLPAIIKGDSICFGGDENNIRFLLNYWKNTNDTEEDFLAPESFELLVGENISNFSPVQLSYTLKLRNPQTTLGTYGQLDLNGDGIIDGTDEAVDSEKALYTNLVAILDPVDSQHVKGKKLLFPMPSVEYTVEKKPGGGGGGGGIALNYTLTYDSNGGTTYPTERYTAGTKVTLDKVPTRMGYQFTGWYSDADLSKKIDTVTMNSSKTVYAGWKAGQVPSDLNGDDHFAYIVGYPDGSVQPQGNITRAETAEIFFRLLKDDIRDGNLAHKNPYGDSVYGDWYNPAVSTLTKLNIIKGMSPTEFAPNAPITRAQFAAICARFDTGKTDGASNFSDISGHWAEKEIERAVSLGWIAGYEDGTFRPDQSITRAEAMSIINRVLKRLPETDNDLLKTNMTEWFDNTPGTWYYLAVQEATNSHDYEMKANGINETWTGITTTPDWYRYQEK